MEAIPRGLVSRDMIKMIPGIKCLRTNILPSHHSGNHQFTSTASNKVTFQIPSFEIFLERISKLGKFRNFLPNEKVNF